MLQEGKISAHDLDLILLTDSAEEACEYILACTNQDDMRRDLEESVREVTRKVVGR